MAKLSLIPIQLVLLHGLPLLICVAGGINVQEVSCISFF
jgi:hypothetical protein